MIIEDTFSSGMNLGLVLGVLLGALAAFIGTVTANSSLFSGKEKP